MSQLNPLRPLDFDYERFPGIAMRATDQALEGHELTDRPEQILLRLCRRCRAHRSAPRARGRNFKRAARSHVVRGEIEEVPADRSDATQIEILRAPVEMIEEFLSSESLDAE